MPVATHHRLNLFAQDQLSPELAEQLESDAAKQWDLFYRRNADKFFKDRHYFDREFPQLLQPNSVVLEVGCGVGNTVYPLLELNHTAQLYACDFAATAVGIVKQHPQYSSGRVHAFEADITDDDLTVNVPTGSVDFCTMVFVLSAIAPSKMKQAIRNVAQTLQAGTGRVLFRDYADGDLAQARLDSINGSSQGQRRIGQKFYARGDGTRCYYFEEQELQDLFTSEGFTCEDVHVHERSIENRKQQVVMHRRWIQAVFLYNPSSSKQQQWQEETAPAAAPAAGSSTHVAGAWLAGSAGRLAHQRGLLPGVPSGRALLPDTLDCGDLEAGSIVPGLDRHSSELEKELEESFFSTISRDSRAVAEEEAARAQLGRVRLEGVEPAAASSSSSSSIVAAVSKQLASTGYTTQQQCSSSAQQQRYSYGRAVYHCSAPAQPAAVQLLLRYMAANSAVLQQRRVLELEADCSGLVCLAALRHARHVTAASSSAAAAQRVAGNLAANGHAVVVERVRCRVLGWRERARLVSEPAHDVVLGCLPAAGQGEVGAWVAAAAQLLGAGEHARVVLCCSGGSVVCVAQAAAEQRLVVLGEQQAAGGDGDGCVVLVLGWQ